MDLTDSHETIAIITVCEAGRRKIMTELLDTQEAAKRLGVTPGTLMVWRSTKRYPLSYVRIGRNVRYRPADLEKFLEARTVSGVPEPSDSRRARRSCTGRAA
jgi:excisionase family DNA binding protein